MLLSQIMNSSQSFALTDSKMVDVMEEMSERLENTENNEVTGEGSYVVLKSESNTKIVKAEKRRKVAFEKHYFFLDNIISCPFGSVFEVDRDKLKLCEENIDHLAAAGTKDVITNPIRNDGESQKLSRDDIESLKAQGLSGKDIVDQLVQNSSTFNDRTEFSKAKYKNRKTKKHMTRFTILKPTTLLIAETAYYAKDSQKICDLRPDALSQILTMANIRANSRTLVVDQCQGLAVGAVLDRMGGYGSLVHIYHGDFPTRSITEHYNFPSKHMEIVNGFPLNKINSLSTEADSEERSEVLQDTEMEQSIEANPDTTPSKRQKDNETEIIMTKAERERLERRRKRQNEENAAREELLKGNMDSLVIVCKFLPSPVLLALLPFMAPSRPFVVFSQYKEPLMECYVNLRANGGVVNLQLTETWLRYYQVLPSRTHPNVNMNTAGGYLLSGITVEKDSKSHIAGANTKPTRTSGSNTVAQQTGTSGSGNNDQQTVASACTKEPQADGSDTNNQQIPSTVSDNKDQQTLISSSSTDDQQTGGKSGTKDQTTESSLSECEPVAKKVKLD